MEMIELKRMFLYNIKILLVGGLEDWKNVCGPTPTSNISSPQKPSFVAFE